MEKALVLLSGGIDSSTLLHYVRKEKGVKSVYALTFLYGQKHSREIEMAKWQADVAGVREHSIIDFSDVGSAAMGGSALTDSSVDIPDLSDIAEKDLEQPSTYVPNRNMILLSIAAAYAESHGVSDVFYGAQQQDEYGYWDCTVDFLDRINKVLALNRKVAVEVHAPFIGLSKSEVMEKGYELGVDYDHTWTCYRGGDEPCGVCPSCVERDKAFRNVRG
jgi:7-cyano-7-deazaguanine synthase